MLLTWSYLKKCLPLPPPQRTWSAYGDHGKCVVLSPPPNLVGFMRSRNISATTPPPVYLVGLRRSRKMYLYRVHRPGAPPKQKSWLRRCAESIQSSSTWASYFIVSIYHTTHRFSLRYTVCSNLDKVREIMLSHRCDLGT